MICEHLQQRHVETALLVQPSEHNDALAMTVCCLQCNLIGNLGDFEFERHFALNDHSHAVKVSHPRELYCWICGDFQYSDYFDISTNRKRDAFVFGEAYTLTRKSRRSSKLKSFR